MSKNFDVKLDNLNKQIKDIEPIELIIWAFEHGYKLGKHDMREGIHIKTSELKRQLVHDLDQFVTTKTMKR